MSLTDFKNFKNYSENLSGLLFYAVGGSKLTGRVGPGWVAS